jgi:Kef-type K+ transport system membrane component KefB
MPGLLGLILAGALLGPPGAGIVKANDGILGFFSEIGKLMLMFLIGLEISLAEFNKARLKAVAFGVLTFAIPLALAVVVARHFGYSWNSSILIGSLLASHTLLAFPLLEKAGLQGAQPVAVTVGATIFTDIAALLTLAICASIHTTGFSERQIAIQVAELVVYVVVVVVGLSAVARRLVARFRNSDDATLIAILIVMVVASMGAVLIRLEDIIGAFLAGLAVNSIARSSRARDTIRTVGQALFIPAFFFSIGTQLTIGPLATQTASTCLSP